MYFTKGKSFAQYVELFSDDLPIVAESTAEFSSKFISSKCSSQQAECNFDNPAEIFLVEV